MLPLSATQVSALMQRARAALSKGLLNEARRALEQVAQADPGSVEAAFHLSRIAFEQGDRAACLSWLDKALALAPKNARIGMAAAERFRHFNRPDKALAAYDQVISLDRKALKPRADKAHYLQLLGRFDEAEALFVKLIKQHPRETELYRIFLATRKVTPGDPHLRAMKALWNSASLPDPQRMHLGFALAKSMEDIGQPDQVFAYLDRANALQRAAAPFDAAAQDIEFDGVRAAQAGLDPTATGAPPPLRPVFVTGMPRSGTTLVERILGAHSAVTTGGEMGHAMRLAYHMFGVGAQMRPLDREPPAKLRQFAESYVRLAQRDLGPDAQVVTDKSILSHLIFGLIRHSLPGARIIVVHRDPRDIALSIYKNHFTTGTHRYANDLSEIAGSIKRFRRSVAHWRDRMPGLIHEIRYEDLVSDPEPQSRALVAAAGLDWEDACLTFHNSGGAVKTLSVSQVRQPIHRRSAQAWKTYETELTPFIAAWGDEPWD